MRKALATETRFPYAAVRLPLIDPVERAFAVNGTGEDFRYSPPGLAGFAHLHSQKLATMNA